jgi:hypothetical protein
VLKSPKEKQQQQQRQTYHISRLFDWFSIDHSIARSLFSSPANQRQDGDRLCRAHAERYVAQRRRISAPSERAAGVRPVRLRLH